MEVSKRPGCLVVLLLLDYTHNPAFFVRRHLVPQHLQIVLDVGILRLFMESERKPAICGWPVERNTVSGGVEPSQLAFGADTPVHRLSQVSEGAITTLRHSLSVEI